MACKNKGMKENLMTALGEALETAQNALAAAEAGNFAAARELLDLMDTQRDEAEATYGLGNAAHSQRRAKITRVEAATRELLPAEEVPAPAPAPAAAPAQEKKVRNAAPAQTLTAEQWGRVGAALAADGVTAEARAEFARTRRAEREALQAQNDRFGAQVAEREALQAEVEAAALTGDVDAANAAWDRLFDVCTAIRTKEGIARRAGKPCPVKLAAHIAARDAAAWVRRAAREG